MIIPSPTAEQHHILSTRGTNNNGTANSNLSNAAIIVIVLVAAGFAVLIGFSITRFFVTKDEELERHTYHDDQKAYMQSLRRRNFDHLKYGVDVKVSGQEHYDPPDLRASGVTTEQSSRGRSPAFSP